MSRLRWIAADESNLEGIEKTGITAKIDFSAKTTTPI